MENLTALLLNIKVEDFDSGERLDGVRVDFEALTKTLSAEGRIASTTIRLIIEIHGSRGRIDGRLISEAARWGYVGCFRLLRETYGVDVNKDLEVGRDKEATALHIAAAEGHIDLVKFLLALPKANIDIQNTRGETPLFLAVQRNAIEMVKCLLDHKAQVNAKSNAHWTPLLTAASHNFNVNIDVFRVLMAYGADINASASAENSDYTALNYAIRKGEIEKVRLLLENGAHINEASYRFCGDPAMLKIRALLDDFKPTDNADIDNIFVNIHQPRILRETFSESSLLIPPLVGIVVDYARQLEKDSTPDDKSVQTGPTMSRIARVRQALQEDLPALFTAGIITDKQQREIGGKIISKLKSWNLLATECQNYSRQREQAQAAGQNPTTIVLPWARYKVEVLKTTALLESKGMPRANPVSSADQTPRDNEVSSNAAVPRMPGVGFDFKAEGKPKEPDAAQKKTKDSAQGSDTNNSDSCCIL